MKKVLITGFRIVFITLVSNNLYAIPYLYNPNSSDIYIVQAPNPFYADPREVKAPKIDVMENLESIKKGQELSASITRQQQQNNLNRILAKNTLPNGEVDLIAALADARKGSSENINIIAQMISEQKYRNQQMQIHSEKTDADKKLNEANLNLQNSKNESLTNYKSPSQIQKPNESNEEKVNIEHISDNLYKTDDHRIIKTQTCNEYVYSEKAVITHSKLIFKNGKICDIEKIIDI